MRTIKFRAWVSVNKEMVNHPLILDLIDDTIIINGHTREATYLDNSKYVLMQFTGLKDKHDKDIYEGDIAEYTDYYKITRIGKIKFVGGCFKIETISDGEGSPKDSIIHDILSNFTTPIKSHLDNDGVIKCDTQYPYVEVEVIGNIYENPELIKKEELL